VLALERQVVAELLVDDGSFRVQCGFHVDDRFQRLPRDMHMRRRILSLRARPGHDRDNSLALPAGLRDRERMLRG
jgi:hypothetical protein